MSFWGRAPAGGAIGVLVLVALGAGACGGGGGGDGGTVRIGGGGSGAGGDGGGALGAKCGDGVVNNDEDCDDGNAVAGDGCSPSCKVEAGFSCAGSPSACTPVCGDGLMLGAEKCDDGNVVGGDGCSPSCQLEPGFTCAGAPSHCDTTCGDGVVAGKEACDDGNETPGDGCDASCAVEKGYACHGSPSTCATVCGDGLVVGAEQCDDGGKTAGDGCDGSCQVEVGYQCSGQPSACATVCGDGILAGKETCDDGGVVPGDGCDATCRIEPGYGCSGAPSACAVLCGNGVVDPGEQCDDGNPIDTDGCTNNCKNGPLALAGEATQYLASELAGLGETWSTPAYVWGDPDAKGVVIIGNDGGLGTFPDYSTFLAAGRHLLVVGGSGDDAFSPWLDGYLATDGPGLWHESSGCTPDWTSTASHPLTKLLPATYEFDREELSYHPLHLSATQPAGVVLLGATCDNPDAPYISATRRYASGGTFTYLALDLGTYQDPAGQSEFIRPFLQGYLAFVRSKP